jgi:hypothetical protein
MGMIKTSAGTIARRPNRCMKDEKTTTKKTEYKRKIV